MNELAQYVLFASFQTSHDSFLHITKHKKQRKKENLTKNTQKQTFHTFDFISQLPMLRLHYYLIIHQTMMIYLLTSEIRSHFQLNCNIMHFHSSFFSFDCSTEGGNVVRLQSTLFRSTIVLIYHNIIELTLVTFYYSNIPTYSTLPSYYI